MDMQVPDTRMTEEEAQDLVRLLMYIAPNIGWSINRPMEPPRSPPLFNAYHAIVAFPGGGRGEAHANNPGTAFRLAWAAAHVKSAALLTAQDGR